MEWASTLLKASLVRSQGDATQGVIEALEGLARLAVTDAHGREGGGRGAHRAVRLLGATAAGREAMGLPVPPGARVTYERDVAALQAQLDDVTWETGWAEGRAMSLEQAITYALDADEPVS